MKTILSLDEAEEVFGAESSEFRNLRNVYEVNQRDLQLTGSFPEVLCGDTFVMESQKEADLYAEEIKGFFEGATITDKYLSVFVLPHNDWCNGYYFPREFVRPEYLKFFVEDAYPGQQWAPV